MSIAQRFKELDAKLAQAPAALTAANDDSETLDKALALLRRQLADMKALLKVVKDQKVRLANQEKTIATLRRALGSEIRKEKAQPQTKVDESATKKLLDQRYPQTGKLSKE